MTRIDFKMNQSGGFSLVELLVAGVLGLILLAGVISVFSGSRATYRTQEQLANVQTDGRFALMYLESMIQNAGWQDNIPQGTPVAITGEDNSTLGGTSDSISPTQFNIDSGQDCNGEAITGANITNVIYVDGDTLMCDGSGAAGPQPIVENVESFQVLYGIDSDANGVVNQYVSADQVTDFSRVLTVKVGLMIVTEENATGERVERTHNILDETVESNDLRLRRVFATTIAIPNQAYPIVRSFNE